MGRNSDRSQVPCLAFEIMSDASYREIRNVLGHTPRIVVALALLSRRSLTKTKWYSAVYRSCRLILLTTCGRQRYKVGRGWPLATDSLDSSESVGQAMERDSDSLGLGKSPARLCTLGFERAPTLKGLLPSMPSREIRRILAAAHGVRYADHGPPMMPARREEPADASVFVR